MGAHAPIATLSSGELTLSYEERSSVVANPNAAHVVAPAIVATDVAAALIRGAIGDHRTGHEGAGECDWSRAAELGIGLAGGRDHAGNDGQTCNGGNSKGLTHFEISRVLFSEAITAACDHWSLAPAGRFKTPSLF